VSSIRYKIFSDGRAMNNRKMAGMIVQMVSISCPSIVNLSIDFPMIKLPIR